MYIPFCESNEDACESTRRRMTLERLNVGNVTVGHARPTVGQPITARVFRGTDGSAVFPYRLDATAEHARSRVPFVELVAARWQEYGASAGMRP
jgi:hypothetical protein